MQAVIADLIARFDTLLSQWAGHGKVERLAPYAYRWTPPVIGIKSKKSVALTLQAITHGNEVGGIVSLIECLQLIQSGVVKPEMPLAFVLGNFRASLADKRFLEVDLNRSFGTKNLEPLEAKRSLELTPLLGDTDFFLDFHQTIEPSLQPFFIFPYAAPSLAFARACHADVSVVTHWGKPFSLDGMCTDEFVNYAGGVGITIELGQKGFDTYQSSVGLQAALGAIHYVQETLKGKYKAVKPEGSLYTWKATEIYQDGMDLKDGLVNFQWVEQGEVLGVHGSKPLLNRESGWLLFPKYQREPGAPRPREIYRIAKRIEAQDLGQAGVIGV